MTGTISLPEALLSDVVTLRRDIHMHPELGFEEHRTAAIVADRLRKLGFEVHSGIAKTGVIGVMRGIRPGRTIMLRADMDALPILEENAHAYRSTIDGKMHACGHDGHVAILLGAAQLIADGRDALAGTVCLLFQPAEEGHGGARVMIEEGVIERFGIERAYGLHLNSKLPVGSLGFREGPMYASSDSIEIDVLGKGGHGSAPHDAVDPIYTAANFITSVQQVVSRHVDPIEPAVVTIASIHGGTIHNVIPRTVRMLGTVRAFSDDVRKSMPGRIERVLKSCCDAMGASYDFTYLWRYPVTSNDPDQTRYARALAERTAGEAHVVDADKLMGAEDFSFFAQRVPACFYSLGARGGESTSNPHHSSTFDIDERCLPAGVQMMAALAFDAPANAP
ncbi:MAG TPA: M20 family metallopeptidase [Candidatus Baltobacteraceae bacterium]|nr:M20 family metallopeptidase [Candidatus Baltobacteraceae bacterium]